MLFSIFLSLEGVFFNSVIVAVDPDFFLCLCADGLVSVMCSAILSSNDLDTRKYT